jgi:DNA (cytosine-5)-methyltransferase 1
MKPRALDLFCCQGGMTKGLQQAGFHVTGVDIDPQPRYCGDDFYQADALTFGLFGFDLICASPPCQADSNCQRIQGNEHPRLIPVIRARLRETGVPYVIENVVGADLIDPVLLCGAMFGLRTYRHRLFESNIQLQVPEHPEHTVPTTKMGRPVKAGEFMHVVGNFAGAELGREVMGMPWASREGLREAIPPAYGEFVGRQAMTHLLGRVAA